MNKVQLLLGFFLLLVLVIIRLWDPYPLKLARSYYFDALQQIKPRDYQNAGVRVVDVDEESLRAMGQWPWPRDMLAEMVDRLRDYGAAIVVFDVMFAEKDRYSPAQLLENETFSGLALPDGVRQHLSGLDYDEVLADSFGAIPVVLGTARTPDVTDIAEAPIAEVIEFGDNLIATLPPLGASTATIAVLRDAAAGIGAVSVDPIGQGNVVRTVPLVWQGTHGPVPSLAIEALRVALGETSVILWGNDATQGVIDAVGVGEFDIPTLPDGQIWVRFRHENPDLYVSAHKLLQTGDDPALRQALEGHIVFVGTSAAGLLDIRNTALGENVPGVSIQAQIVEQVLLGDYLIRTDWVEGFELVALVMLGLIVGYRMSLSGPIWSFVTGFASAFLVLLTSWMLYTTQSVLFDATYPLVGGFLAFVTVAGYQFIVTDMDKRQIRRSFSQYVAPSVLEQIEQSGYQLKLGGEIKPVTVMFCDVLDFTRLSEKTEATELVAFLNELFDKLSTEILDQQGTIDKFIGDSVMAFWNAPIEMADHHERACRAAIQMRRALAEFNSGRTKRKVRIATGLSSGNVCVGNVGSRSRFDYSVVGDTVNVAARVEAACRHVKFDIVASQSTIEEAPNIAALYAGNVALKGVSASTRVYAVVGGNALAASDPFKELLVAHDALVEALALPDDDDTFAQLVDRCIDLSAKIEADLSDFYQHLPNRRQDFH